MVASCAICGRDDVLFSPDEERTGICAVCEVAPAGGVELPARRRDLRPCDECGSRAFVRTLAHEQQRLAAVSFLVKLRTYVKAISKRIRGTPPSVPGLVGEFERGACVIEYVICRGCGLTRCYAIGAARLPLGPGHATEYVSVPDSHPFR